MAVGIFHGRAIITDVAVTLDSITGGTQTYGYLALRTVKGIVVIGNSGVTLANGFSLGDSSDQLEVIGTPVIGASLNIRGNGELQYFGISTA